MNDTMPIGLGLFLVGLFAGIISLCWFLLVRMPRWTRPDIYFAVTVTPAFRDTPEAHAIETRYRRRIALHSSIGLMIVLSSLASLAHPGLAVALQVAGMLWQSVWIIVTIALSRRETLPFASAAAGVRAASLEPRHMTLAGGWIWTLPVVVLLGCAAYLGLSWEDIPERFPTHWGASGQPDAWSDRSFGSVMLPLFIGLALWMTMFAMAAALPRFTRRRAAGGPLREREQKFLRFGQWAMLVFACWITLFTGALSLLPLSLGMNDALPAWFFIAIGAELAIAGVIVFFAVRFRSGRRNDPGVPAAQTAQPPEGDGTPDSAWKLGLFYYNPDDPALLVEKRFGIGWDLNWGRPAAWLVIAMIMLPAIVIPIVVLLASNQQSKAPSGPTTTVIETPRK